MASVAKRPDGQWRARYRDPAGKEHSKHFERKVDAQRWLTTIEAETLRGTYIDPKAGRVTVAEYAQQWLDGQPLRASSRRTYGIYLRTRIVPVLGARPLSRYGPATSAPSCARSMRWPRTPCVAFTASCRPSSPRPWTTA